MYNESLVQKKPVTKQMIELLMECHERELMQLKPCQVTMRGVMGLVTRQLATTGYFVDEKGKRYLCVFITIKGKNYLKAFLSS